MSDAATETALEERSAPGGRQDPWLRFKRWIQADRNWAHHLFYMGLGVVTGAVLGPVLDLTAGPLLSKVLTTPEKVSPISAPPTPTPLPVVSPASTPTPGERELYVDGVRGLKAFAEELGGAARLGSRVSEPYKRGTFFFQAYEWYILQVSRPLEPGKPLARNVVLVYQYLLQAEQHRPFQCRQVYGQLCTDPPVAEPMTVMVNLGELLSHDDEWSRAITSFRGYCSNLAEQCGELLGMFVDYYKAVDRVEMCFQRGCIRYVGGPPVVVRPVGQEFVDRCRRLTETSTADGLAEYCELAAP